MVRPAEGTPLCEVHFDGLFCALPWASAAGVIGPRIVMGTATGGGDPAVPRVCWLTEDATMTCNYGPRFAPGQVLWFTASDSSDSMCAIYSDGSVWCIGSNDDGKLGTGDTRPLEIETRVAPPGSARVACDP